MKSAISDAFIGFFRNQRRSNELLISIVAFILLITMSILIDSKEIPDWEITSFEIINGLPGFLYPILWPFMQYGVFVTIPFVSAIAFYFKRYKLAIILLLGGIGIYIVARLIKEYIPRGRPSDLLEGVLRREETATGSKGFTSGHTAVAATIATFSHYYLTKKWQIISIATLAIVVIGRIYVGAHLPLDVFGGVALGVGVASLVNYIIGVPYPEKIKKEDTKEWISSHRPRHPGDIIRIFVGVLIFAITTVLALSGTVGNLEEALFHVINYLPSVLSPVIQLIMQFGALYFVFIASVVALILKHNRLALKILVGGVGAWSFVRIAKEIVGRERPAYILNEIVERASNSGLLGFPSGHSTVAGFIATVAAPYVSKTWSRVLWSAAIITALGRVFVGAHLPLDIIAGLALGWVIGSAFNLAFGTPAKPWPKKDIQSTLKDAGLTLSRVSDAQVDARGSVPLFAKTRMGKEIFIKLIDTEHRNADILYRLWRYITFNDVQDEAPFASAKQHAEHEAYLSIQAAQADVNVPEVLLSSPVNNKSAIIVTERINGNILSEYEGNIDKKLLEKIWKEVKKLHENRIAHRDLRATNILIDNKKNPWLIDFSFSQTAASDIQITKDIVELLTSLSMTVDNEQVVSTSIKILGKDIVSKTIPYLQPLSLTSYSRKRLDKHPNLINDLLNEILTQTKSPRIKKANLSRLNIRWFGFLFIAALTIYYFAPRIGELDESIDALKAADIGLVIAVVFASVITYVMATFVVIGSTTKKLSFGATYLLQLATTAVNRITPKGIGGAFLTERYLEKSGLKRIEATASVSLIYTAGFLMHLLLTATVIAIDDPDLFSDINLSSSQLTLVTIASVIILTGIVFIPRIKQFVIRWGLETRKSLKEIIHSPLKSLQLFGGSIGITLSYAIAFSLSIDAFGPGIALQEALFVYLASGILASAAPTPGGLGATEAVLSVGLSLSGVPIGQAITSVLVFRLITFWLPIIPGVFALRHLRKNISI